MMHFRLFAILLLLVADSTTVVSGQTQQEPALDMEFTDIPLSEAISRIEKNTRYTFFYDAKQTDLSQRVNLKAKRMPISAALKEMLAPTGLNFTITERQIALIPARKSPARQRTITGVVNDSSETPLAGVAVTLVGDNTRGAVTEANGSFTLTVPDADITLSFTYLGYVSKKVAVPATQNNVKVFLTEDAVKMEDVVVVGYGQVKKSDLTGSVASVKAEKLTDIPANSIDGLLQGRVAGVQVVNSSQDPGASSTVRIRGNSSLNGSNAPLVVIDGFPWGDAGDLKQINPQDIVSMEVLKDASASAIYGSRGANGVILITTRKAQENVTRITLRQQTTVSGFSSELNLWRDPVLMAMLSNESSINAGLTPTYIGATNANGVYYPSIAELQTTWTTNTRWDDLVFRPTPVSNNTTVQVQSSNDRTMFQASANYYLDNGMYIEDTYRKYGGNFSVEHKLLDNLRMKASANITSNKRHNNGGLAYWRNPIFPVYDDNGDYWLYGAQDYSHPLALTNLQKNDSKGLDIISFASVNWDVLPCLNVMAQFNYKHGEQITDNYFPKKYSETGVFNDGYGSIDNWKDDNIVFEAYATFDRTFAEKHRLTVMGGYSYENYQSRSSSLACSPVFRPFSFTRSRSLSTSLMATSPPTSARMSCSSSSS